MRIHEALASHSKDEKSMDYERRHGRKLDYKINVDLEDFYCGLHIKWFLDWIVELDNLFWVFRGLWKEEG